MRASRIYFILYSDAPDLDSTQALSGHWSASDVVGTALPTAKGRLVDKR